MSVPGPTCPACGAPAAGGQRFCTQCAAPLALSCPACGATAAPGSRFCGQCATPLGAEPTAAAAPAAAERRLVTVLFADLVGFTSAAEHRDPEEVRDLLGRYFDRSRTLIERYGGTVEKFIGDAVMAVWGTPVAHEDDAERAVRAALALTTAVTAMGEDLGMPDLRLRAGLLTGETAVNLGAVSQGMVAGDAVNTASRLQSVAEPGTVLVDDATRRVTEAAIAYEDGGTHALKGRDQPVRAWRALRVVAGVGGARRGSGLEAPFVGRDAELATIVETSDASARERRARLVWVAGDAGMGKSRLGWEFYKHLDGVSELVRWHRGRCLSYGDGVAYWALAEMVRARAGIVEDEDPAAARRKLHEAVERHVADERERALVEPRLAHLLGLDLRTAPDRADLFSVWRLFFERIADEHPVVLVFEDMQWADSGLLDFVDYLLEWSADHPIFVLALARPDRRDGREPWASARPNVDVLRLGPLGDDQVDALLSGLVPGLPDDLRRRVRERAEGVPLYAVETVRMLLDRGVLAQEGARYVLTGDVGSLDVPETLHALAAARLDGLAPAERALLQDASVIGQTFTPAAVAALSGRAEHEAEELLRALVAKQVVGQEDDPLSSELGHFGFLQSLLRTVAYGTLSRRDRKARHLAATRHLREQGRDEPGEAAEVLAAHYLEAIRAEPDAPDAGEIRALARETLADAGRRAASLALGREARHYFDQAAELADRPEERAALLGEAGRAAWTTGDADGARARLQAAGELFAQCGRPRDRARVLVPLAEVLVQGNDLPEAAALLDDLEAALADGERDATFAEVAAGQARSAFFRGDLAGSLAKSDLALETAERLGLPAQIALGLVSKAIALMDTGRIQEATALLEHAIVFADEHDVPKEALRARFNLGEAKLGRGRFAEAAEILTRGAQLARERGDLPAEQLQLAQLVRALVQLGKWDEAVAISDRLRAEDSSPLSLLALIPDVMLVHAHRGDTERAAELLEFLAGLAMSDERDDRMHALVTQATGLRATGRGAEALPLAREAAEGLLGYTMSLHQLAFAQLGEIALEQGDDDAVRWLIDNLALIAPGGRTLPLNAQHDRFDALLRVREGDTEAADQRFRRAAAGFREAQMPFALAQVLVEHAEQLVVSGRGDEARAHAEEAGAIFAGLGARPWIERAAALRELSRS